MTGFITGYGVASGPVGCMPSTGEHRSKGKGVERGAATYLHTCSSHGARIRQNFWIAGRRRAPLQGGRNGSQSRSNKIKSVSHSSRCGVNHKYSTECSAPPGVAVPCWIYVVHDMLAPCRHALVTGDRGWAPPPDGRRAGPPAVVGIRQEGVDNVVLCANGLCLLAAGRANAEPLELLRLLQSTDVDATTTTRYPTTTSSRFPRNCSRRPSASSSRSTQPRWK